MVNGEIALVKTGSAVLFPKGEIHMLQNLSDVEMKVACFFAPPAGLENYKFFDDIDFPDAL
jgi:mannose-6-phosphate isomerase-like protein (cupin superfamily)